MSSEGVGLKHAHTLSVLENTFMATAKEFTFPVTDERVIGLLGSSSGQCAAVPVTSRTRKGMLRTVIPGQNSRVTAALHASPCQTAWEKGAIVSWAEDSSRREPTELYVLYGDRIGPRILGEST